MKVVGIYFFLKIGKIANKDQVGWYRNNIEESAGNVIGKKIMTLFKDDGFKIAIMM